MTFQYTLARLGASLVGLCLLGASAHVAVTKAGGWSDPTSLLIAAIALGVGVGSIVLGFALAEGRKGLALAIAIALVCGEICAFLQSGERIIASREAAQVPLRQAMARYEAAKARVEKAEAARPNAPTTSARLEAALANQTAATTNVATEAAKPGCRENCRQLLQAAVDAATLEVAAARSELKAKGDSAQGEIEAEIRAARAELEANPKPGSSTALADRLGITPTALDLLIAALGSFAVNGLAAALLVFASHGGGHARQQTAAPSKAPDPEPLAETEPSDAGEADAIDENRCRVCEWLSLNTRREFGAKIAVGELFAAYQGWARANAIPEAMSLTKFGKSLDRCGVEKVKSGKVYALDVSLITQRPALRVIAS